MAFWDGSQLGKVLVALSARLSPGVTRGLGEHRWHCLPKLTQGPRMEKGALRTRLASLGQLRWQLAPSQRDAFGDLCSLPCRAPTTTPCRWGARHYVKAPRRGGSCKRGEICHRQPAACWRGGLVTQPAEGVVTRLLAPARAPWARAARHPQTEHPALLPPCWGLCWPRLTPGAWAWLRHELPVRGSWGR